jgi:arsenate reductase
MHIRIRYPSYRKGREQQKSEGWTRFLKGNEIEAYSAGIETHGLNPDAVKVMAEAGVDISEHKFKNSAELKDVKFDVVVTVCGDAHENCPVYLGKGTCRERSFKEGAIGLLPENPG